MIQSSNKKKIGLNILYYFCNVYNGCYKHKGEVMNQLEIICTSCNYLNKIEINKLKLAKEFNCVLCSLIILIVDNELITQVKGK